MQKILPAGIMLILLGCLPVTGFSQTKLIKKETKKGKEMTIPYEQYELSNGLTLLIHEDHSDPLVHVDVTYHVGSAREEIGKSGFAHFFEHMMFQGSENVADEQHFKIITEAGGTLNGTTNRDRTNYFETVPANQLEKMLWLEADRMGFLLDAVTQEKFEIQRATVKNERGQRYDNVPYGLVREVNAKTLYPYGHPYSWLTIGYVEDLNRVTVDDLKDFFLRWYGPNNAVLTVGGAVHTPDVIKLVEKYFGSIPRGPEVKAVQLPMPVVEKDRYVTLHDHYAKLPMLQLTFPTPPQYHKEEAALDCLADIIGGGKTSVLYKDFIKTQKAVNAYAYNSTSELSGEFTISITPFAGQSLKDLEQQIRASIKSIEENGISEEEVAKFRAKQEASMIRQLETVSGKVSHLAAYYTFTGNAGYLTSDMKRYASVTKEEVLRVYRKYLKDKPAVILSVTTKNDTTNIAAPDNYIISEAGYKAPDYGYGSLKPRKAKDNFDRSRIPDSGPNPVVQAPAFWTGTVAGSIQAIGTYSEEIPMVTLQLKIPGGKLVDAHQPGKSGLTAFFAAMMNEDTRRRTAEDFSMALETLGSSIRVYADTDGLIVNMQCLRKNLSETLKLLQERLEKPDFKPETFNRIKKRTIENIRSSKARANSVASEIYPQLLYGKDHVLGWPFSGTDNTVENITLEDINLYYNTYISRSRAQLMVVGEIQQSEIISALGFLNELPEKTIPLPELKPAAAAGKTTLYFIDVPKAAQTEFRIGNLTGIQYDALGAYFRSGVMNYPLGGAFNSRLNIHLRETKGWTYGARAYFSGNKYTGSYTFSAGILADATDSALQDVLRIIEEYRTQGITQEELDFTKNAMGQSEARQYESQYQKAGFLERILEYNLPADFPTQQNTILQSMTQAEINQLAQKNIPGKEHITILLVGDKSTVWEPLVKNGYQPVELDTYGNLLNGK